jgi:opacity protein-like surface antigen
MERTGIGAAFMGVMLATTCIAQASAGEDTGWYAGAGVGQSSFDFDGPRDVLFVEDYAEGGATDSYQVFGGFRTSPYLALEVAYVHAHGHTSEFRLDCRGRPTCQGLRYDVREKTRSQRLDMAVVATLPVGQRVELFGKLGLSRSRHRVYWDRAYANVESPTFSGSFLTYDDMNTGLVRGWGARFKVSPAWVIRAQYESADEVGGPEEFTNERADGRPAAVDNWWLGTEYRF